MCNGDGPFWCEFHLIGSTSSRDLPHRLTGAFVGSGTLVQRLPDDRVTSLKSISRWDCASGVWALDWGWGLKSLCLIRVRSCLVLALIVLASSQYIPEIHGRGESNEPPDYPFPIRDRREDYEAFSIFGYPPVGSTPLINPQSALARDDLLGGAFHPTNPNRAIVVGGRGELLKWDGVLRPVQTGANSWFSCAAWKPDGSYALTIFGGKAYKYDEITFTEIPSGLNYDFQDVAWKPGGSWALVPCYDYGLIYNFTGTGFTLLYNGSSTLGGRALRSAFWSGNGALAFIVGEVGTVVKYASATFTRLSPWPFVTGEILYGMSWKPDGSYALIVGGSQRNGPAGLGLYGRGIVMKYDGTALTMLVSGWKNLVRGVSWKPDGSYALICGGNGSLIKYDGSVFTALTSGTGWWLRNIAWKPDGSYALICGFGGTLLKYDGTSTTSLPTGTGNRLWDVAWKPDGSQAIICGELGTVLKYDGFSVTMLPTGVSERLTGASWKPSGEYSVIVGLSGRMLKFDGSTFTIVSSGTTSNFYDVSWKPDGSYAIVSGPGWLRLYDGSRVYGRPSFSSGELYTVAWKPGGSYALIGGNWGLLMRYWESPVHFYGAQYIVSNADDNNLYFVPAGLEAAGKVPGVSVPSPRQYASNMMAAGLLYGLANRLQKMDYDTGGWVDHSTGKPLVSAIPAGRWILLIGSPDVHNCVRYYTKVSNESSAYGRVVTVGSKQYYQFVSRTGAVLYSQDLSRVGEHEDAAILMVFRDADGRFVVIIFGVGYQGSWAAAVYFKERMRITDDGAFDEWRYIVKWVDSNMDGVPQVDEILLIPLGKSLGL